jgi:bifunctional DNase/RNase
MAKSSANCSIVGVAYDEGRDTPVVLLREDRDGRVLFLPVGAFEASAVISGAEGLVSPQPTVHDVLARFFTQPGVHLERLELWGSGVSGYFGRFLYRKGWLRHTQDVRPADGIAVALRAGAPIVVDPSAFGACPADQAYDADYFRHNRVLFLDSAYAAPPVHAAG